MNTFGINVIECYEASYPSEKLNPVFLVENSGFKLIQEFGSVSEFFHCIYVLKSSNSYLLYNHKKICFEKDNLYLIKPGTVISLEINQYVQMIELKFNVDQPELTEILTTLPDNIECKDREILRILKFLLREIKTMTNDSLLHLKVYEMMLRLKRTHAEESEHHYHKPQISETNQNDFIAIIDYIHRNYKRDITLIDLANTMHMEKSYFSKKFKTTFKVTPMAFLNSVRLSHSLNLLEYTDYSIYQISEMVGFNNSINFINQFKKNYNLTPKEYRLKMKKFFDSRYQ